MIAFFGTLAAAAIAGIFVLWKQHRDWKEQARDRLRTSYAEWAGALNSLRKKHDDLQLFMFPEGVPSERVHEAYGLSPQQFRAIVDERARDEQLAHQEEERAFARILLLDQSRYRKETASRIRELALSEVGPNVSVDESTWNEHSTAISCHLEDIGRSITLDGVSEFWWGHVSAKNRERDDALARYLQVLRANDSSSARSSGAHGA